MASPRETCIRQDIELAVDAGAPVLCWSDGCLRYEPSKRPVAVAHPPRHRFHAEAEVRDDGGRPSACNAHGCVPLGSALATKIADIRAFQAREAPGDGRDGPLMPVVTRDRSLVYLAGTKFGPSLWRVADDKAFEPRPPAAMSRFAEVRLLSGAAAGDALLLMWGACRVASSIGCGMDEVVRTSLIDAQGHDLDGEHDQVTTIVPVAADRYIAYGDTVLVIERGKVIASRPYPVAASSFSSAPSTQIERIDDDHAAILSHGTDGWRLSVLTLAPRLPQLDVASPSECPI